MSGPVHPAPLGWLGIVRLGLVQTALGSIVVLTNSTMNRVMVVELALPAMVPGLLVALHHAMQMLRPRLGHGSDVGGRRTPWIVGGMIVLAAGGVGAAGSIVVMADHAALGIALACGAFTLIGLGLGGAGTSLLVLLAKRAAPERRAAAATLVWVMMLLGFIVTSAVAGALLDPFTPMRLLAVTAGVATVALLITFAAVWGVEGGGAAAAPGGPSEAPHRTPFRVALAEVWAESQARRFTIFILVSMLAYSAQDLILEPFAGTVFGFTPGESTRMSGIQNAGVLIGMGLAGLIGNRLARGRPAVVQAVTLAGCLASALALAALAMAGAVGPGWPLRETVFVLGVANGAYVVGAIGSMMALVDAGRERREGVRMGLWGAAQAVAFGVGGFAGTAASDALRALDFGPAAAYASVFAAEAVMFAAAAVLVVRLAWRSSPVVPEPGPPTGAALAAGGALAAAAAAPVAVADAAPGWLGADAAGGPTGA